MTGLMKIHLGALKRQAEDEKRYRCEKSRPTLTYLGLLQQIETIEKSLQKVVRA